MNETYVYDGKEVVLTGRTAIRKTSRKKEHTLHEIRPCGVDVDDVSFCSWVKFEELYLIQEPINITKED